MFNNFAKASAIEKNAMGSANEAYKSLGITNIRRCSWNTEGGRKNQKDDIDLIATWNGKRTKISEKFRTLDAGDILVELLSDIDNHKPGSYIKSQADYIFYHMTQSLYILDVVKLQQMINDLHLNPNERDLMGEFSPNQKSRLISGEEVECNGLGFRIFPTYIGGDLAWEGLCVFLPLDKLKDVIVAEYMKKYFNDSVEYTLERNI